MARTRKSTATVEQPENVVVEFQQFQFVSGKERELYCARRSRTAPRRKRGNRRVEVFAFG